MVPEQEGEVAEVEAGRQIRPIAERRQDPGNPLHVINSQSRQGVERRRQRRRAGRQVPQHPGKGPTGEAAGQGRAQRLPDRREGGGARKRDFPLRGLRRRNPAAVPLPRRRRRLRK